MPLYIQFLNLKTNSLAWKVTYIKLNWQLYKKKKKKIKLAKRGIDGELDTLCASCSSEWRVHIIYFSDCRFHVKLWMECLKWFGISATLTNNKGHLLQFMGQFHLSKRKSEIFGKLRCSNSFGPFGHPESR